MLLTIIAAIIATYFVQVWWLSARNILLRVINSLIAGFVIASVGVGSYFWIVSEFWKLLLFGAADAFLAIH